jgi:hypothetical protein
LIAAVYASGVICPRANRPDMSALLCSTSEKSIKQSPRNHSGKRTDFRVIVKQLHVLLFECVVQFKSRQYRINEKMEYIFRKNKKKYFPMEMTSAVNFPYMMEIRVMSVCVPV